MNRTVAIGFSKSRPLQLDLCLSSLRRHCTDYENLDIYVITKIDGAKEDILYSVLQNEHPTVKILEETNMRKQMLELVKDYNYVLFFTDDTVFVDDFSVNEVVEFLIEKEDVLGFSLRLGANCEYCYPVEQPQSVPECLVLDSGMILWDWNNAEFDWNYPFEVSSSVYDAGIIGYFLNIFDFPNPNHFEFYMDNKKFNYSHDYPMMAAYITSRAFAIPVNKINKDNNNRSGTDPEYSADSLLTKYEDGVRIDPAIFDKIIPNACHYEVKFW